jgi:hypothetical protein
MHGSDISLLLATQFQSCLCPTLTKEFHMGIRFNTNTWRAPLLLIDSWLPLNPERPSLPRPLSRSLQRFSRAGWLGRNITPDLGSAPNAPTIVPTTIRHPCRVRLSGERDGLLSGAPNACMVISGRIDDVCNELERLAALELQAASPH